VTGNGTLGRLTKWVSFGSTSLIGDTTIFEDKNGRVGVGTDTPTSRVSVVGTVESLSGGFKFPDGSVQTTSAAGALSSVTHNATLVGAGTAVSPLQVASPLEVRDTDNPARQPFQAEAGCSVAGNFCNATITVPAGKQLIIEYASMSAAIPTGEVAFAKVITFVGGRRATHSLSSSSPATAAFIGQLAQVGQLVRLYADPGSTVTFVAERGGPSVLVAFSFSIAGYLVDLP
jgi:hypothetical protein